MVKNLKGFTLIEILVVLSIMLAVTVVFFPRTIPQMQASKVENSTKNLSSLIFQIQQDAYTSKNSKSYGIAFYADKYTTYVGSNFSSGTAKEDTILPSEVRISAINLNGGSNDLNFSAGNLKPANFGSITISTANASYKIDINKEGFISITKL